MEPAARADPDHDHQLAYFEHQLNESNEEFWSRFERRPEVGGRLVLDLGCGHGAMSIALAQAGATILGVDLERRLIEFARRNLETRFPGQADRVSFEATDITDLDLDQRFDLAVCKDTFEHIADVPRALTELHRLLKPGGELWAGFSPLFFSPRGDHGRSGLRVPWAHVVLPHKLVLRAAARHNRRPVDALGDIGLNGMTPAEFRDHVAASPFKLESIAYNRGGKMRLRALDRVRRLPGLERYATVSIYAVLVRPIAR